MKQLTESELDFHVKLRGTFEWHSGDKTILLKDMEDSHLSNSINHLKRSNPKSKSIKYLENEIQYRIQKGGIVTMTSSQPGATKSQYKDTTDVYQEIDTELIVYPAVIPRNGESMSDWAGEISTMALLTSRYASEQNKAAFRKALLRLTAIGTEVLRRF